MTVCHIGSFTIPERTGSDTEYYQGMINHDQKTIRICIPTATWESNAVNPRSSDGGSTFLPVYFNTVTPAMYEAIVYSVVPSITLTDSCSMVTDADTPKDFLQNQIYTVTAEDGTTANLYRNYSADSGSGGYHI